MLYSKNIWFLILGLGPLLAARQTSGRTSLFYFYLCLSRLPFHSHTGSSNPWRWTLSRGIIQLIYMYYVSPFRSSLQFRDYDEWLTDFSFLIVPLFTVWNMLPLMYFVLCNRLVGFWCDVLERAIHREQRRRKFSLRFYYRQFLRIADLQAPFLHKYFIHFRLHFWRINWRIQSAAYSTPLCFSRWPGPW